MQEFQNFGFHLFSVINHDSSQAWRELLWIGLLPNPKSLATFSNATIQNRAAVRDSEQSLATP